jgi:hypothetical protein
MPTTTAYPLQIRGDVDESISPWLFLVKWILIIPHLIVLAVLGVGMVFSWFFALVAIVFTGRYPIALFEFNVGVLRWGWRVGFYSYQSLGTDKYPPFSLQTDPAYPADLSVEYPVSLRKGRTFVQWWVLAIPHYLIVAVFVGNNGGLQGLLVLFGAVANLFTGRFPKDLRVLVMGMNHWIYRVAAYALLFTNEYPPFSLGEN